MTDAGRASTRWFGTWCVVTVLGSGLGGEPAVAADFDAGVGYSLAYSSNVSDIQSDPGADVAQTVVGGFAYRDRTPDLNTYALVQTERYNYLHGTFGPGSAYFANGELLWTITPQQLLWSVQDVASEVRLDLGSPDTPNNRTNTNSLSTGPDFTVRLTTTDTAAVGGRYGRFDVKGPGDNQRYSAYARWLRQLGPTRALSLNYEVMRADFQESPLPQSTQPPASSTLAPLYTRFLRQDWFARYDLRFASTNSMTMDLGTTRLQPEGGDTVSGRLVRLTFARQINPGSSLRLLYADQVSDTYIDILRTVVSATVPTEGGPEVSSVGTNLVSSAVYRAKREEFSYLNGDARMRYSLRGYFRSFKFEQPPSPSMAPSDQEERGWQVDGAWLYSNETQMYAHSTYLRRSFLGDPSRVDRENNVTLGVTHKLTRNIGMGGEGGRYQRVSEGSLGNSVNWHVMLFLTYSTGPLYTAKSRR